MPRLLLLALGCVATLVFARAETPALLTEALLKSARDESYWAYTETSRELDAKGRSDGETVMRFDPSKPYPEQFTPLKINGKPPTERQRKEYRKRGEERGRELEREDDEPAGGAGQTSGSAAAQAEALESQGLDLARAKVVNENERAVSYEVPLRKAGSGGPPVESFRLVIRVNRARRELENMTVRVMAPVRVMLVAKVSSGELQADYAVVDPQFPAVMTSFGGTLSGSLLFIKGASTLEEKRSEFQRVKPFGDRFRVKIGPLRALSL